MKARIVTIGQTAIACFKTELEMTAWRQCGEGPIDPRYIGEVGTAPHKKLAPLHPDFMRYYADALMVLWRGTHKLRGGTESAKRAFMDCLPQGTQYVIIWNPITHDKP